MIALETLGWFVVAIATVAVVTRVGRVSRSTVAAVLHDALPQILASAWLALGVGLLARNPYLVISAVPFVVLHVVLVVHERRAAHVPGWVGHSPVVRICVANVFVDNETPDDMARNLIDAKSDVIVIVERNNRMMHAFDAAGGCDAYPHRIDDPDDHSDYAVAIVGRQPFRSSQVCRLGDFRIVQAELDVDGVGLTLIGVNPWAVVDPGGAPRWADQTAELERYLRGVAPPTVVAGDFNSTTFRPAFAQLLDLGYADAHDLLGRGLHRTFKLGADGLAGALGPVTRLDHALVSRGVFPVEIIDLDAAGSDHVPFIAAVAVKRPAVARRLRPRLHRRRAGG